MSRVLLVFITIMSRHVRLLQKVMQGSIIQLRLYVLQQALVDVAIIINMSLSMMILVTTMTIREPLEFSIFPSLLLITTLFRLGINVSTTRNILSNSGSSGQIIKAFGDFILQGNVVVGLVIYLIIVLVKALFWGDAVAGYPTIVSLILFLGGFILLALGIIGEYLGRIFLETKRRPPYFVNSVSPRNNEN